MGRCEVERAGAVVFIAKRKDGRGMSEFSKYFNYLIKCRNLKHVQVAEMCKIDTSIIFRWANGKVLPKSWGRLEPIVRRLRLTPDEVSALCNAYRREVLGESQSHCFDEIMGIFQILGQKMRPGNVHCKETPGSGTYSCEGKTDSGTYHCKEMPGSETYSCKEAPGLGGGISTSKAYGLNGKMEVWQSIRQALAPSPARKGQEICLKLHGISDALLMELKGLHRKKGWERIHLLLCGGNGTAGRIEVRLRQMQEVIELLFQKGEICISCLDASEAGLWEGHNWMISDDFFLQFTEDMSYGLVTGEKAWIAFFQEQFVRLGEKCQPICKNTVDAMAYVERGNTEEGIQIMALEYMPCISLGLTEDILQEQIHPDIPFREELIQKVIAYYSQGAPAAGQLFSYFTKDGLVEFMESGRIEIFPEQGLYSPASMRQRCEILANIIALAQDKPDIHFFLLKEDFPELKGIHLEQWLGTKNALWMEHCLETGQKEEIAIVDKEIQQAYSRFFAYLKKGGKTYGEAETLACMRDVLDYYCEKR